jgi:pilus assembly protein Flp/PilA
MEDKMEKLIRFFKDEEGATAVEYGLMVAGIAVAIIVIVFTLGGQISALFQRVSNAIAS